MARLPGISTACTWDNIFSQLRLFGHVSRTYSKYRSKQVFGGAEDFCPNFPKLARIIIGPLFVRIFFQANLLGWRPKKVFMWFCKRWAPFLPRFSGILRRFSQILSRFPHILSRFSRMLPGILPTQKFWGCACTPFTLPITPLAQNAHGKVVRHVLLTKTTGKRRRGCPRTRWSDYIFDLAGSRLFVEPAELSEIVVDREVFRVFLLTRPSLEEKRAWKRMNNKVTYKHRIFVLCIHYQKNSNRTSC